MPDVHAGKGCAIGTTMTISDKVPVGLVGGDIGCGVTAYKVDGRRLELQKLDKLIRETIPSGREIRAVPHRLAQQAELERLRCLRHVQREKALRSIGTLGGGNHFIEVDRSEDGALWLVIHSGSRHLGTEVAAWYQKEAFSQCSPGTPYELAYAKGELMADYLCDMKIAQIFGEINRFAIADTIIRGIKWSITEVISTTHNYIDTERMILRKGAVSAQEGERLILPMNMRDGCLLCIGKGNPEWNYSAPHGAGRAMSRAETRLSFTLSQYKREMNGIYSSSVNRDTLDECPMAYKSMEEITAQIAPAVDIVERLRPIYNFKAGE